MKISYLGQEFGLGAATHAEDRTRDTSGSGGLSLLFDLGSCKEFRDRRKTGKEYPLAQ